MSESDNAEKPYSPPITYSEVPDNHIAPLSKFNTLELDLKEYKDATPLQLHSLSHLAKESLANVEAVTPHERVLKAVDLGKNIILDALHQNTQQNRDAMSVLYIPAKKFDAIGGYGNAGSTYAGLDPVLVRLDENKWDYDVASFAFHELVHRWAEMQHHAYTDQRDDDANVRQTTIEQRRHGLHMVKHIRDSETGALKHRGQTGEYMNELGNYAWQQRFLHTLFEDANMQSAFKDEIEFRNNKLKETFGEGMEGSVHLTVDYELGNPNSISIDGRNLYWEKNGKLDVNTSNIMMQLVDELSKVVGKVGESADLTTALISIKTRPHQQNIVRQVIDSKFGKGFYQRLKGANYHNIFDSVKLLEEVQKISRVP